MSNNYYTIFLVGLILYIGDFQASVMQGLNDSVY